MAKYVTLENLTYYHGKVKETFAKASDLGKYALASALDSYLTTVAADKKYAQISQLPSIATSDKEGLVKPDGTTITVEVDGTIKATQQDLSPYAKKEDLGEYTKTDVLQSTYAQKSELPKNATTETPGLVQPDGETITIDPDSGVIKAKETDLTNYALKSELPSAATLSSKGLVKPDGTTITVTEDGTISVNELDSYLKKSEAEEEYAKTTDISDMLTKTDAAAAYETQANAKATKTELEQKIETAISSAYQAKGSVNFAELPELTGEDVKVGDVYNVKDSFTTDENFVEGTSQKYPAGSNVVCVDEEGKKWDVLAGITDLSGYVTTDSLETIQNAEIDALFTE